MILSAVPNSGYVVSIRVQKANLLSCNCDTCKINIANTYDFTYNTPVMNTNFNQIKGRFIDPAFICYPSLRLVLRFISL